MPLVDNLKKILNELKFNFSIKMTIIFIRIKIQQKDLDWKIFKKNKIDERFNFLKLLLSKSDDLIYNIFGFNNIQPIWGDQFIKEISKCKFALNLSRGQPIKYYSSNRIASIGCKWNPYVNR